MEKVPDRPAVEVTTENTLGEPRTSNGLGPLPAKTVLDRHLPTGIALYGYTADQMRAYGAAGERRQESWCVMAIHEVNGQFVASSRGVWISGVFEDERTARFAFRLPDEVLTQLQQDANARAGGRNGVMTWGDLARASEQARLKTPNVADKRHGTVLRDGSA